MLVSGRDEIVFKIAIGRDVAAMEIENVGRSIGNSGASVRRLQSIG